MADALRQLLVELRYLDARFVRRRFCFECDRQTIRQHLHCRRGPVMWL